jgi:competence protein ComEC
MSGVFIEIENYLMNNYPKLEADVIKIGHHGSQTSSSMAFMDWVNPQVAVIMAGVNNRYGHPHSSVINTLLKKKIDILRTDIQGSIVFQERNAWIFWR